MSSFVEDIEPSQGKARQDNPNWHYQPQQTTISFMNNNIIFIVCLILSSVLLFSIWCSFMFYVKRRTLQYSYPSSSWILFDCATHKPAHTLNYCITARWSPYNGCVGLVLMVMMWWLWRSLMLWRRLVFLDRAYVTDWAISLHYLLFFCHFSRVSTDSYSFSRRDA